MQTPDEMIAALANDRTVLLQQVGVSLEKLRTELDIRHAAMGGTRWPARRK